MKDVELGTTHDPTVGLPVLRAVRSHLASIAPSGEDAADDIAALLGVAEDLLRRAEFEAEIPLRRAFAAPRLAELLPGNPIDVATAMQTLGTGGDTLRSLVAVLRETDVGPLPEHDRLDLPTPADTSATDDSAIANYLRARGEERELLNVKALAGGFSKETILITLRGPSGDDDIVLRKVAAGRAAGSIGDEFTVLRFVADRDLPVAEPLWFDPTGGCLSGALFASRKMPGKVVGTVAGPDGAASGAVAGQLAETLGRLHALDVTDLVATPRPATGTTEELFAAIDEREAVVDKVAEASPTTPGIALHRALLAWLRANVPQEPSSTVLVHGDVGFHNLLVHDGQLSALLDWELSHRGRPAEDLAYVRPSVTSLIDWAAFLDRYYAAGGLDVDDAELRFFTVWQDVWRAVSCLRLRAKFLQDPARLADGVSGLLLGTRFLDSALETAFGG